MRHYRRVLLSSFKIRGGLLHGVRDAERGGVTILAVLNIIFGIGVNVLLMFAWVIPEVERADFAALQVSVMKVGAIVDPLIGSVYPVLLPAVLARAVIKAQFGHRIQGGASGGMPMPDGSVGR